MIKRLIASVILCLGLNSPAMAVSYFPSLNPPTYLSTHITTATTTLVKTGSGSLRAICVNTPVATGTVKADDALTDTTPVLGVVTTPATAGNPYCQYFNLSFAVGLTIVTTQAQDVTVVYQ